MPHLLIDGKVSARVSDLLDRMSLDQKIGQMTQTERLSITSAEVKQFHIGSVLSGGGSCPGDNHPSDWVAMCDAYWAASMEEDADHLAIPIIYGLDAIHGNANVLGATVFPHNIGLGACNDGDLLQRIAQVSSREILATGADWTFAPTLAVAEDIRWGRSYESYSADPSIVASYADRFVSGLQNNYGDDAVVACLKHWVGDGGTTHGIDQGETTADLAQLQITHVLPYIPAIEAGALTVMVSFSSWNGDKCHGHEFLISDLLKEQLGFAGFVISDWDGIDYLADDYRDAIRLAVNAGVDMFMVSETWKPFLGGLRTLVNLGEVSLSRIDDAVRRILSVKVAFGLFDKPRPAERRWSNDTSFGCAAHREVAREAVRKSLVLLKNEENALPLRRSSRILVAGKNVDNCGHQCGGFTVAWQGMSGNDFVEGGTSVYAALADAGDSVELSVDGSLADENKHDIAVVVIGERPYAEGMGDIRANDDVLVEAGSQIKGKMKVLSAYGRSLKLHELHPEDLQTIASISEKNIPVVVVLISGRPLVVNQELRLADAFVAAWLPGSEGAGVADVLFGDYDFHGRLSFAWPKNECVGVDFKGDEDILYPIGYGLNYAV